jgi:hypothetical protein
MSLAQRIIQLQSLLRGDSDFWIGCGGRHNSIAIEHDVRFRDSGVRLRIGRFDLCGLFKVLDGLRDVAFRPLVPEETALQIGLIGFGRNGSRTRSLSARDLDADLGCDVACRLVF